MQIWINNSSNWNHQEQLQIYCWKNSNQRWIQDREQRISDIVYINFVSDNQVLVEKVRHYAAKQDNLCFTFSREPELEANIDLFVIEADKFGVYAKNNSKLRDWLPKAIAFGSQFFLKKSFLLGCIDYLKDPWELEELDIRLNLALKQQAIHYTFSWGKIAFAGLNLLYKNESVKLTYQENRILKILLRHRGEPVPREVLFYAIWNNAGNDASRVVDMHISALRKKINRLCSGKPGKEIIMATRGKGYIIPG